MAQETGSISIHAENILPIIKKWLYSEKEIFLRELVSNAADAIHKLEKLSVLGEVKKDIKSSEITITIDKDQKTLTISDTGLGLSANEVKKYINQVAFSGLKDFVEKYQDKSAEQQIIGHFGLGFYSSFMVAHTVEIESLSYKEGAEPIHWSCDGSTSFTLTNGTRKEVGTDIILKINDDSLEMLEEYKIREIINKYCSFIRAPIKLKDEILNDPKPLWLSSPNELKDEDYKAFFQKLFPLSPEPMFWIHLNVDFPFNLKGILYFPKLAHELDASSGQVKLYCNQVFVDSNTKELLPEWLTLLKGAIDCPDLPLNVSRSNLQNEPQVKKIAQHITKKVADKLIGLAKTDRKLLEAAWEDISGFVKFGMIKDDTFYEKLLPHLMFKLTNEQFATLGEYLGQFGEKTGQKVLYTSDPKSHAGSFISMLKEEGIEAIWAPTQIDAHFLPFLEMRYAKVKPVKEIKEEGAAAAEELKVQFQRIDADISEHLVHKQAPSKLVDPTDNKTADEKIKTIFEAVFPKEKIKVRVERLKSQKVPAVILFDENKRRMREMANLMPQGFGKMMPPAEDEHTLVVNESHPAIRRIMDITRNRPVDQETKMMVEQIYDLAYIQQGTFSKEQLQSFVERSTQLLELLGNKKSAIL